MTDVPFGMHETNLAPWEQPYAKRLDEEMPAMSVDPEAIRAQVMDSHVGRSWSGHPVEDMCPCPKEPCGLVSMKRADPECADHALTAGKTIRQSHSSERCPGHGHP